MSEPLYMGPNKFWFNLNMEQAKLNTLQSE